MLTRLAIDGFKNLHAVDVRFGPFTCIAGANGVGKSNLFDAIAFLAALAEKPLMDAALVVRGGEARRGDVRSLFRREGEEAAQEMRFLVEMIIPELGEDSLGQPAQASMTFLRYDLRLRYRADMLIGSTGSLEIAHESMVHINRSDAKRHLLFPHKPAWRDSVVKGRRTSEYISTEQEAGVAIVSLHADGKGGTGGRPRRVAAARLPRTMLSSVNNAAEHRTLVLARQEMTSWMQLQLEPSALRSPDTFTAPRSISSHGAHVPATLHELAQSAERVEPGAGNDLLARVANRLSNLVEDVRRIRVDVDEKRQLLNIVMTDRSDTEHVAGALSDGTLRFLTLIVMEADPKSRRLLCLEEPENGMHPLRIPTVIGLLDDLAVDVEEPVDEENPLRQVIVNTHSPSVVACVDDGALLVAQAPTVSHASSRAAAMSLRPLAATWRSIADPGVATATRGDLLAYLNPFAVIEAELATAATVGKAQRVVFRRDLQMDLPHLDSGGSA